MRRVFPAHAYSDDRIKGCFWAETVPDSVLERRRLQGQAKVDVAVIGGGFTGLSAALHLAQRGVQVAVLDTRFPGWGASGRNGGFCCLGGSKLDDAAIDKSHGRTARLEWRQAEKAAIDLVAKLIRAHKIEASVHSQGETLLAHKPSAAKFDAYCRDCEENYGVVPEVINQADLPDHGLGGAFHGAMTTPLGFALNPRQYLVGLLGAAENAGADVFGNSSVTRMAREGGKWRLSVSGGGVVDADQVIVATNGYSSEDVPEWMAARTIPAQSSVIVTRPLTVSEQEAQGWTSDQMAYDTRRLLHYFRKMPDGRFLFGMRGGLRSSPQAERRNRRLIRQDFETMFPAWRHVETNHYWSGMVCLSANLTPFAGPVSGMPGVFAGFAFHGNGVAMGTYTGALLADHLIGKGGRDIPAIMQKPADKFPLGRFRRALMFPAYALYGVMDRFG